MNDVTVMNKLSSALKTRVFWVNSLILFISMLIGVLVLITVTSIDFTAQSNVFNYFILMLTMLTLFIFYMGIDALMHYFSFRKNKAITFSLSLFSFYFLFIVLFSFRLF